MLTFFTFSASGSFWSHPAPFPYGSRVRRDVGDPTEKVFPETGENTRFGSLSEEQPTGFLEQKKRNDRWRGVWKNKRETSEDRDSIPVQQRNGPRGSDDPNQNSGHVHLSYSEANWCGLSYCRYSSLDAALFALHNLLTGGMERMAVSAESIGRRVGEEVKAVGGQLELVVAELSSMKKSLLSEGEENRETWRGLRDHLGAIRRATELVATKTEEQTRGEEAALAQFASVLQTSGNALTSQTANMVSQISVSSDTEARAINGISKELQAVVSELERHNNERKKEAQASGENIEEAASLLNNGLEMSAGMLANKLELISGNMTAEFYAVRNGIESIPRQIGHLAEYMKKDLGDNLVAIDETLKSSFKEANLHLEELPNVKFDAIESALANINKDFTATLEIEGEKLRNSIREHGQEQRLTKRSQKQSLGTTGFLEDYLKEIVEQNRESNTDKKFEQAANQMQELRKQLNENANINKLAAGSSDISSGISGLQQSVARGSQMSYLGNQFNQLNNADKAEWRRSDLGTLMMLSENLKSK